LLDVPATVAAQSPIEVIDQALLVKGLAKEANGSGIQRALSDSFLRESRDEDNGRAVTLGEQYASQFHSAQIWHLDVRDQTRRVIYAV
jgi:hypothetical protein